MHWTAHNSAIYKRLHNLQNRRGVTLKPKKLLAPNLSIEQADYVTQIGHRVTAATYDYACKKSFQVRHSSNIKSRQLFWDIFFVCSLLCSKTRSYVFRNVR